MKILVGYDGSNAGKEALSVAVKHAKAFDAALYVVRSLYGGKDENSGEIEEAERDLAYAEELCGDKGIACETHLLIRGLSPGEDLLKFADDNDVEEIVIGVRRRSRVGKILFGSNARFLIMEAQCPVVAVK